MQRCFGVRVSRTRVLEVLQLTNVQPGRPILTLRCQGGLCALEANGRVVETRGGIPVRHRSERLMQAMLERLGGCRHLSLVGSSLRHDGVLDLLLAFEIHHDLVLAARDEVSRRFGECLAHDPVLSTCPGPECSWQLPLYAPVWSAFAAHIDGLRRLCDEVSYSEFDPSCDLQSILGNAQPAVHPIRDLHTGLSLGFKTMVAALHRQHRGQVLAPLALALGRCTLHEYVDAVTASRRMLSGAFRDVRDADERQFRSVISSEAEVMVEYCRLVSG